MFVGRELEAINEDVGFTTPPGLPWGPDVKPWRGIDLEG